MKAAFIYTEKYQKYDYGHDHPLQVIRLKLTYELLKAYGIFEKEGIEILEPEPATDEDIALIHSIDYINVLKGIDSGIHPSNLLNYGLGWGDNPVFKGIYEGSLLVSGASLQAARMVESGEVPVAFNIAGGLHHAMAGRASGFCYFNDPAIAIADMVKMGKRVLYVDIDAHHGDGVQHAFYKTDRVMTISLHESGRYLFPGTGDCTETGEGKGKGYSVNLPFYPGTGDEVFLHGFHEVVLPLAKAFSPDILVTQLGTDSLKGDPLTHLELTNRGFSMMVNEFKNTGYPWVALGGGGYNIINVAMAWAIAFSIMAGIEIPDALPEEWKRFLKSKGLKWPDRLRDNPSEKGDRTEEEWAEKGIKFIKKNIFPVHGI
jgi:acetoin utilization protein AcuC